MLVLPKCIYCKTQQTYVYRQDYQNPFVYSHATIDFVKKILVVYFSYNILFNINFYRI